MIVDKYKSATSKSELLPLNYTIKHSQHHKEWKHCKTLQNQSIFFIIIFVIIFKMSETFVVASLLL